MDTVKQAKSRITRSFTAIIISTLTILLLLAIVILIYIWINQTSTNLTNGIQSMGKQELETEKLRQEVINLRIQNESFNRFWEVFPSYASFITAVVAVAGIVITIWKQITETSRQKQLDREQRESEIRREEIEKSQRIDEKFTTIVRYIGAESESVQAASVVTLLTFLKTEYKSFHEQIFMLLLANLQIQHTDTICKLLIEVFEKSIRIYLKMVREEGKDFELDLSRANLERIDLSNVDISYADLAFANLKGANLTEAQLWRVRGFKVNLEKARLSRANLNEARMRKAHFSGTLFHDANLVAADLKETDLKNAEFFKAKMQSAHLEKADISGAKFEQADINDAFFAGIITTPETLKSLTKAFNWQKAHFDEEIRAQLEKLVTKV